MESISVDLFEVLGSKYLVTVDRFSGYLFVDKLTRTSTSDIIGILNRIFSEYGYPKRIRSDGGPQFRTEFKAFCIKKAIIHEQSSPYYPQSNGHAESGVKIAKYLLLKTGGDKDKFREALSSWRNTPKSNGKSPSELMFGRILRSTLPRYQPSSKNPNVEKLTKFKPGMKVRIQDPITKRWTGSGTLLNRRNSGSWRFQDTDGFISTRNELFLKPKHVEFEDNSPMVSEAKMPPTRRRSPRNLPVRNYR